MDPYRSLIRLNFNFSNGQKNISNNHSDTKKYWEIFYPKFSKDFDISQFTHKKEGSKGFDIELKKICIKNKNNIDLLMLLRCRVSHAILGSVYKEYYKWNKRKKISFEYLLSSVLHDRGDRDIKLNNINKESIENSENILFQRKNKKINFDYKLIIILNNFFKIRKKCVVPFVAEIIKSFRDEKETSIATYTYRLVKTHKEFSSICYQGKNFGDYSLLFSTSKKQLKIACEKHGVYELNILNKNIQSIPKNKANLIIDNVFRAYKYEYPKSKQIWQKKNNLSSRSSGWKPDKNFYHKLVSNSKIDKSIEVEDIEKILEEMIIAIRKEKNYELEQFVNLHNIRQDSEDNRLDTLQSYEKHKQIQADNRAVEVINNQESFLDKLIEKPVYEILKKTILKDKSLFWEINIAHKEAWFYFSKGMNYTFISERTGLSKKELTYLFKCPIIADISSDLVLEKLKLIAKGEKQYIKKIVKEFKEENNSIDEELILIFSKRITDSISYKKTIYDKPMEFKTIRNNIVEVINPKKGIKKLLVKITGSILKELGVM